MSGDQIASPVTASRAREILGQFEGRSLLVVGDLMLDRFLWGNVSRISPEAPVPVVEVESESSFPGGAANVARNLRDLGAKVLVAGAIGQDAAGEALVRLFVEAGIDTTLLARSPELMTTVKTRVIARHQQVVRVDRERRCQLPKDTAARLEQQISDAAGRLDAAIIEDYAKGVVTQRLAGRIGEIAAGRFPLAIDPNPRNPLRWSGADVIKPNRKEAIEAAGLPDAGAPGAWEAAARKLLGEWDTRSLLITLGEEGMALIERNSEDIIRSPGKARDVFDVSGAGDTAIAVFALARACGATGIEAMELANHASGIVVGKLGTATVTREELLASFNPDARS